ncbi:MAG: hypothetical protein ACI978_002877, partial [Oleispira sp.]
EAFDLYVKEDSSKQLVLNEHAFDKEHLATCYRTHKNQVLKYFSHRDDFLIINMSNKDSLDQLLNFLDIPHDKDTQFPHVNIGKHVSGWREYKHPNKVNALSAGKDQRKFFDYK